MIGRKGMLLAETRESQSKKDDDLGGGSEAFFSMRPGQAACDSTASFFTDPHESEDLTIDLFQPLL